MDLKGLLKKSTVTINGEEREATELPLAAYSEMSANPELASAIVWKWSLGFEESAKEIAAVLPPRLLKELQDELVRVGLLDDPDEDDEVKNSESVQTDSSSSD